jgi:hypothetical protein
MSGKGGAFERDICKDLSRWIQGKEKPYIFWRGRGSGGVFTSSALVGEAFAGDIYLVRQEGKFLTDRFSIECKTGYKEASIDKHLKYNKSDPLKSFWEQCTEDARKTNKSPLLIYQKKGMQPKWVGINTITRDRLRPYLKGMRYIHLHWAEDLDDTWFYGYDEFFLTISPEIIEREIDVSES